MFALLSLCGLLYIGVVFLFLIIMFGGKDDTIKASREHYGVFIVSLVCFCWGPLFFLCGIGQMKLADKFVESVSKKRVKRVKREQALIERLEKRGF